MAATTTVEARATRRAAPAQGRRDVVLLLGPCVLYLLAFSVFPLVYSLYVALCDYDQQTGDLTFIGLDNFRDLFSSDEFWQATRNTAIFTFGGVALQVVLGTALALFFDQKLRGAAIVRGILILPMLLTPIVIGLMWRMLLNPDWGLFTWAVGKVGIDDPQWLSDPDTALRVAAAGGHVAVDAVRVHRRLRAAAGAAARGVRGERRSTGPRGGGARGT